MTKMPWPVVPIKWCSHLQSKKPSQIGLTMLRPITGGGQLHHCAARAWEAMKHAAMAEAGINLKPTSSGDTFRSIQQQKAGFLQRFQLEVIEGAQTRTYDGKKWYLKKGMAPMATPGTSNHGWGLAVDIWSANGQRLDWMMQNIAKFGWSWEVQSEPWHIRYVAGDAIPQAVLEFEAKKISPV